MPDPNGRDTASAKSEGRLREDIAGKLSRRRIPSAVAGYRLARIGNSSRSRIPKLARPSSSKSPIGYY